MSTRSQRFNRLFEDSDDPWGYRTRWYEERKRKMLLAALSRRRYGTAFEAGCANGELTHALAARCKRLEAVDISRAALGLARRRVQAMPQVRLSRRELPAEWPAGRFDLIVVSEVAYFMNRAELDRLVDCCRRGLADEGELVLCHWRGPIRGFPLDGAQVHAAFRTGFRNLRRLACRDSDFLLDIWRNGSGWVVTSEGNSR